MSDDFEQSVAHAARDRSLITIRWIRNLLYGGVRRLLREVLDEKRGRESVLVYPEVDEVGRAADLFNRMNWYLGEFEMECFLPTPHERKTIREQVRSLEHQRPYSDTGQINLLSPDQVSGKIKSADKLLVWNWQTLFHPSILSRLHKTVLVDPHFYSTREVIEWFEEFCGGGQRTENCKRNRDRFECLQDQFADVNEAYVFATGPSLDTVFDHPIPDDSLSVICNSIVRNDDLLEHLDPDILTFADPVFHFGPNEYAAQFREDAVRALRNFDCWCIVNTPGDALLRKQFPQIADRVIGIPSRSELSEFHFPGPDELFVRSTGNIMTLFMLPIASALADRIHVFGADGREENESYFWEHSSIAQYDGLMNSAVKEHPSFFRDQLYSEYYDKHTRLMGKLIKYGEEKRKKYSSITPSNIPALSKREVC